MPSTEHLSDDPSRPGHCEDDVANLQADLGGHARRSPVTRRQIRYLLLTVIAGLLLLPAAALAGERFGDVSAGGHAPAIGWVADAGVTQGCGDGKNYCPTDSVTRAQMASFMQRLAGHANGVPPSVNAATLDGLTVDDLAAGHAAAIDNAVATALAATLDDLVADVVADLQDDVDRLQRRVADLETLLEGVSRDENTVVFSGANLQIVNGEGETASTNGVGNLILGYNEFRTDGGTPSVDRAGSHNLVIGTGHFYRSYAGIVAGSTNISDGPYASVTGGTRNIASGTNASVAGGSGNHATATEAVVSGGQSNLASATGASVSGGVGNVASGDGSSVTGGTVNTASGTRATVHGGNGNIAEGSRSSITAGQTNTARAIASSITGGANNTTSGNLSSVSGGIGNTAHGLRSSALGGEDVTSSTMNGIWPNP